MPRDARSPARAGRAETSLPPGEPAHVFGPLRGGPIIHWQVQERRS